MRTRRTRAVEKVETENVVHWWDGGWWWRDEFGVSHGPFSSEVVASERLQRYTAMMVRLRGGERWDYRR